MITWRLMLVARGAVQSNLICNAMFGVHNYDLLSRSFHDCMAMVGNCKPADVMSKKRRSYCREQANDQQRSGGRRFRICG
jgi:hypothetical protein